MRRHLIVGGGMLGSAVRRALAADGWQRTIRGYHLRWADVAQRELRAELSGRGRDGSSPVTVWLCGGLVGGARDNARRGPEYLLENLGLFVSVYREFVEYAAPGDQFVMFGSTCQYPTLRDGQPECDASTLLGGVPRAWLHPSNRGYAMAKNTALQSMLECAEFCADRGVAQYFFLPTNLYGVADPGLLRGQEDRAHVIPALIHRFSTEPGGHFVLTGAAHYTRDFCHVDAAAAVSVAYASEYRCTLRGVYVENLPATESGVQLDGLAHALLQKCNPTGTIQWNSAAVESSVPRKPAHVTQEMRELWLRVGYGTRNPDELGCYAWLDPLVAQYRRIRTG